MDFSWFSRYCTYYHLNKAYNRMCMKCTPGLSGSLKEKPFLEDRNKQEKKKRPEKGRKSTEKEKIKNRKGQLGKQSQCFCDKVRSPKLPKIKAHGMPLAQAPKRLTLICSKYHGIVSVLTIWWFGQVGPKSNVCVQVWCLPHSHQNFQSWYAPAGWASPCQ